MGAVASSIAQAMPRSAGLQGLRFNVRVAVRHALFVGMLVAAYLTATAASAAAEEQAMLHVATAERTSLALVVACSPTGALTDCRSSTAFSVAPGLFVTAAHALLGSNQVTLSTSRAIAHAHVVRLDSHDDIVLLSSSLVLPALQTTTRPVTGEPAVVVCSRRAITGDGLGTQPANYVGHVGGAPIRVELSDHDLLLERVAGAASVLGCSGSPVLDSAGVVTGVVVGGDGESAGMVDVARFANLVQDG